MGRLMPDTEFPDVGDGWQKKDQIIVTEIPLDTDQTPESPRRLHTGSSDERNRGAEIIEQPKSVASTRKRDFFLRGVAYHLPPILVTAFLTVIYKQQWRWPYPGLSFEMEAALQFVAKLHEFHYKECHKGRHTCSPCECTRSHLPHRHHLWSRSTQQNFTRYSTSGSLPELHTNARHPLLETAQRADQHLVGYMACRGPLRDHSAGEDRSQAGQG